MITFRLVYKQPQHAHRHHIDVNQHDFKFQVLERALSKCQFKEGQRVSIRGGNMKAQVVEIQRDINKIIWSRNRPMFIYLLPDDGTDCVMANPAQLKRLHG